MTAALVPLKPRGAAALDLLAGPVGCKLQLAELDRRRRIALYDVYLGNLAGTHVTCRFYGLKKSVEFEFGMLEVAGHSTAHARFSVSYDRERRCDRLYVQVLGDAVALVAEAQPPWPQGSGVGVRAGVALAATGAAALAIAAFTAFVAMPRVVALQTVSQARPGPVQVAYAVRGSAPTTYSATSDAGTVIAAGPLDPHAVQFSFVIPAAAAGHDVRVSLATQGSLGRDERSAHIAVMAAPLAAPAPAPARISSLTSRRISYDGKPSVLVSYGAVGDRGMIRVTDPKGALLGSAPFDRGGMTRVPLIRDAAEVPITTQLVVDRGDSHATAAVELPASSVAVASAPVAAPIGALPITGEPAAGNVASAADPFVVPERATAGQPFRITIRTVLPDMRIALQDDIGATIDERAVPAGADAVSFTAPTSRAADVLYVVCTYTRAASEETLIRSIRILPQ